MSKKRDPVWDDYGAAFEEKGRKQKRRKCKHCGDSVSDNVARARNHLNRCTKIPRKVGWLPLSSPLNASKSGSASASTVSGSTDGGGACLVMNEKVAEAASVLQVELPKALVDRRRRSSFVVSDRVTVELRDELNMLLARAMNVHALPFDLFDNPEFQDLFAKLRPGMKH